MCSSFLADQLAIIPDKIDCLQELQESITSSNNVCINDALHFFIGDHPAQAFERGTQSGGHYKCCSCGCRTSRMDDLAHALCLPCRSIKDLQKLALNGKHGNKEGILKPFESLSAAQLREESIARGVFDVKGNKSELTNKLQKILLGVQRVPTLLVTKPTQPLQELNLEKYTILDCEPLLYMILILGNIFEELPNILTGEVKTIVKEFNDKRGPSDADARAALIDLNNIIQHKDVDQKVKELLMTAVKISERVYSSDNKRAPKNILQLYNVTGKHHELCKSLFPNPKAISHEKLLGI